MKIVLDNNVLFSLLKPDSVSSYIFSVSHCEFIAPTYILSELDRYKNDCLIKSALSAHEFSLRLSEIKMIVNFSSIDSYKKFLKSALVTLSDPKDSPYLALAIAEKACIWSNDPHLKQQSLVAVFSTKELVEKLLSAEI